VWHLRIQLGLSIVRHGTPCRFRVLDECDEMLNMGFVEDVEKILTAGGDIKTQTLLFSATLPVWVKDITRRFLEPSHKLVDLVGTDKMKVG
jgi:ATP-dependent RNA helicase DDX21